MTKLDRTSALKTGVLLALAAGLALFIAAMPIASNTTTNRAYAEGLTVPLAENLQQVEIEALELSYRNAEARVAEAKARVAENQAKIDAVERELPSQQKRADQAIRMLYMMQENKMHYLEVALGSQTFDDFVKQMDYFERVSKVNLRELNKLKDMLAKLQEARVALDAAQAEADAQAELARNALVTLQDERATKQRNAQTSALAQDNNSVIIDGADWHMTEEQFVAAWAPRIDAYLDGSPLAGQGTAFALMAFRYCVDPRWSAAISNTESSKGTYCIRPHNAWGWGAADSDPYNLASQWSSWEEAIEAHTKGLANGYGYTISKSAAQKYCSTPDSWYANTLSEMAKI